MDSLRDYSLISAVHVTSGPKETATNVIQYCSCASVYLSYEGLLLNYVNGLEQGNNSLFCFPELLFFPPSCWPPEPHGTTHGMLLKFLLHPPAVDGRTKEAVIQQEFFSQIPE